MNGRTLKAMKGSVEKWEKIVRGEGCDYGTDNCPLCELFFKEGECVGCPVSEAVGSVGCSNTPYPAFRWNVGFGRKVQDDYERHLAQTELDFLRSLLPQEVTT